MANHSGRSTLPSSIWLRPMNRSSQPNPHGSARFAAATGVHTSLSNHDHTQPQCYPSASQHGPEPLATGHHTISMSSVLASGSPVAYAAKRKATNLAPRDAEQRDSYSRHIATNLRGGGGAGSNRKSSMLIDDDEAKRIMMEATSASKNATRRVGGKSHPRRARIAAIDGDDTETHLSRRTKRQGMPPPDFQLGPPRNQEVDVDSAMNVVTPTQNDIRCAFSLGITDEAAPPDKISAKPVIPPRECVQLGFGGEPGQSSREIDNEKRCSSILERGVLLSGCGGVDMGVVPGILPPTTPHELSTGLLQVGGTPNLDGSHALDSTDSSEADSGVPSALRLPPSSRGPKRGRDLSVETPKRRMKKNGKAKMDGSNSVDVDASKEDSSSDVTGELRYPSPRRPSYETATATVIKIKPRKSARAEDTDMFPDEAPDGNLAPRARSARTAPLRKSKATCNWRVVDPQRSRGKDGQPLKPPSSLATDLRPRVWTGGKEELFATLPALAKNRGGIAWGSLCPTVIIFSEETDGPGLGSWSDDIWDGRRITFSIVREIDVPLQPPVHKPFPAVHGLLLDAGPMQMDTLSLPTRSSNPPLSSAYNKETPAIIPHLGHWNAETNGLPCSSPEAGPSRVPLDSLASVPSSRATGVIGVSRGGMNCSSLFHRQDLQSSYDCGIGTNRADNRQGEFLAEPCLSVADHGRNPDYCSFAPSVQPATELNSVDGHTTLDGQFSTVYSHTGQSSSVTLSSESHQAGSQLPFFPLSPTGNSPKMHTPHMDTCLSCIQIYPQSSALAHANITLPPCESVLSSKSADMATGRDPLPHGSQGLHHVQFPQPPPEVTALLAVQSSDDVVSPVFSRNSPLVRWSLPSEIGHFWSGFFKIYEVKVETSSLPSASNTLTVQHTWRFSLEWVPGGEDLLLDDEQQDYHDWSVRIMRPWWESGNMDYRLNLESIRLLLPLPLLAPFSENSTATGDFPVGYFCPTCGRVNVQRYLRHRICESTACNTKMDTTRDIGWVIGAFSTSDRKVNIARVYPDDKWAAPTTAEPAVGFEDGTRLFQYHLATPIASGDSGASMGLASAFNNCSNVEANPLSVRHIFNGNRALLQASASELFETLQRDVRIERSIGATVFSTVFKSRDDPAHCRNGRSIWDLQAGIIEGALKAYCCDLGALKMQSLRIHAWTSDGKNRQTFCPRLKYLVLLCLGADITLLSILPGPQSKTKSNSKVNRECLRVAMVHGDIVVLSGSKFEFLLVRTGMCMLLEAECI